MIEVEAAGALPDVAATALAVPVLADRAWGPGAEWAAQQLGDGLSDFFDQQDFTGKKDQLVAVPGGASGFTTIYFLGVGAAPDAEVVRRAGGALGRAVARVDSVATTLHEVVAGGSGHVALGMALGQYRFDSYRSEPKPPETERLVLIDAGDEDVAAARRALEIAAAVATARDLVNEPPMAKSAGALAARAEELVGDAGGRVVVHDEAALAEAGFGGILAVGAGSHNPPRLVEMWHEPGEAVGFLALVGKGIVFDSGGLSLKPPQAMETMKTDMSGAAAVIGAMVAIARLELPVRVLGLAPLAENMPGGGAQRPGDVLTARNGKTIEVLNTDAEGRLVLADALAFAAEHEPDLIVDVATLTGACRIALGDHIAGLFANQDEVLDRVRAAATAAGEQVWPMPLPDSYRKIIDSDVADMKNVGDRYGGAITAALLLKEFVADKPWAHLDVAGPARSSKDDSYLTTGATGFGVRTLVALAADMAGETATA